MDRSSRLPRTPAARRPPLRRHRARSVPPELAVGLHDADQARLARLTGS